ncbi:MAG: hypothetical protein M1837_004429 [Sclerophora amabilis]|nr:MAG: hypothetical protein M1837_004429 [Sclerophora amabilis]
MAQLPPQSFSPPPNPMSPSVTATAFLPPNKRQRISPNPSSPSGLVPNSPDPFQHVSLPGNGSIANGGPVMAPPAAGAMGPPSRPVEKATNASELTDAVAQSGIDIRAEENNLTAYFSQHRSQNDPSFNSANASSFDSATSSGSDSVHYPVNSNFPRFPQHNQNIPGSFFGGGSFHQPPVPRKSAEEIAQEEWRAALRRQAQTRALHLNDPFLFANSLRLRINRRAYENGVRLPQEGYSERPAQPPRRVNTANVTSADGVSITAITASLEGDSQLSEILTLLSLAAEERIRGLVEDAAALAAGRRAESHGVVLPEWSDLAVSNGLQPGTETPVEGKRGSEDAVTPVTNNPLKRSFSSANKLPMPLSNAGEKPATNTIAFPNELAKVIRAVASKERDIEEARVAKRARRLNNASSADASRSGSVAPGTPGPGGIAEMPGDRAPEPEPKKISKKELARQQSARVDEAHLHKSANNTARMMLGGGASIFGKKKGGGYSWMNSGGSSGGANALNKPNIGLGGAAGGVAEGSTSGSGTGPFTGALGKRIGEWREDREKGVGIQLRDLTNALEADGKVGKSLAIAYSKLK